MTSTNGLQVRPIDVLFDSGSVVNQTGTADSPSYIVTPALTDVIGYSMLWANIPFTYYVIDDMCNTFLFTDATVAGQIITIAPGTYNAITLVEALTDAFKAGSAYASAGGSVVYTWFVNPDTNKLSVYAPTGPFTLTMAT